MTPADLSADSAPMTSSHATAERPDPKTVEGAREILRAHNEWRRWDGEPDEQGPEMVDPAHLGIAIDTLLAACRARSAEVDARVKELERVLRNAPPIANCNTPGYHAWMKQRDAAITPGASQ